MKKLILVVAIVGILAGLLAAGWLRQPRRWSTGDAAARAAMRDCLEAEMKFYNREALAACERALEEDPEFALAKLKVALFLGLSSDRSKALLADLREADLDRLHETERLLIRYWLLRADREEAAAADLLRAHLRSHPDDPFALDLRCREHWTAREWEAAEACHSHLLEVDPNWVQAQNRRGYAAMAQGRFEEAEDHFRTYLYVAPDQANPHDSLAELLTLRGRYEEAEAALDRALEIRPDFCASYEHLVTLHLVRGDPAGARRAIARAAEAGECLTEREEGARSRCAVDLWEPMLREDWEGVWEASEECIDRVPDAVVLRHRAALETGRGEQALAIEKRVEAALETERSGGDQGEGLAAMLAHLRGSRMLRAGRAAQAVDELRAADAALRFWDVLGGAIFKLYNLSVLARAEEAAGQRREAEATRARLAEVNPRFLGEQSSSR
jgi:tetratricopeptide (TPR) repeat protein